MHSGTGYHTVKMVCKHCRFLYRQEQTAPQHLSIYSARVRIC